MQLLEVNQQSIEAEQLKRAFVATMANNGREIAEVFTVSEVEASALLIPHIIEAVNSQINWLNDEALILPYKGLSLFFKVKGRYSDMLFWEKQRSSIVENRLGDNHSDFAISIYSGFCPSEVRLKFCNPYVAGVSMYFIRLGTAI
jgi:hypothetical protein